MNSLDSIEFNLEKLEYLFIADVIREQIWLFKEVMLVSKELKAWTVSLIYSIYTACDFSQKKNLSSSCLSHIVALSC